MKRYFITLAYNGKNYCGWQIQPNGSTVQAELERALTTVLQTPIAVTGAGRTDAGVHASQMVAHFDCVNELFDLPSFVGKLNRFLPKDIAIQSIVPVKADAHARFDAVSRTYHYVITHEKNPFRSGEMYYLPRPLNYRLMNEAAQILFEYTDFTSFSKLHTDVKTNDCKLMQAHWRRDEQYDGEVWVFTIQADRFLRNMVRAIVGTLIEVGRGKLSLEEFRNVIEGKDRGKAGTSVPAHALFLTEIKYPCHCGLDPQPPTPLVPFES
ncbi:MAG: tRNA pseudouridine(38-40) synthase TruA [Candidatus Symbiothrix sp.]|jgi:tRNA pseudouridine38-40 synthase|nr:tRNA pseudouridine(38-40) synthase TruA [Candidatus Symbiothrix sp.]